MERLKILSHHVEGIRRVYPNPIPEEELRVSVEDDIRDSAVDVDRFGFDMLPLYPEILEEETLRRQLSRL